MSDATARLDHFRKMANDDPNNEVGHYSLGKAYLEAGQHDNAIASFNRVIQLNPNIARVYHLLAEALLAQGKETAAIEQLGKGVVIAHTHSDMTPRDEMMRILRQLQAPIPPLPKAELAQPIQANQVHCSRCNRVAMKLAAPPFHNAQGDEIYAKICHPCWQEWIGMGTKVINELRLAMNEPAAHKIYDQHMYEFLNLR